MINLKPFLEKIAELEKRVKELEKGQHREPKGSLDLDFYEQRALDAERRIAALAEQCARLEQIASAGQNDRKSQGRPQQHEGKIEKDKGKEKHEKEKSKGKESKKEVTKFVGSQCDLHKTSGLQFIPVVHKSETNEQYLCTFCQSPQKVFFNCANADCFHRCCRSCIQPCKTCGNIVCRWCGDCWKCDAPSQSRLRHHATTLQSFIQFNSDNLVRMENWPGEIWLNKVLKRLSQESIELCEADPVSNLIGAVLSLNWSSKGEVRALQFIVPVLRALLIHQPSTKAATFNATARPSAPEGKAKP